MTRHSSRLTPAPAFPQSVPADGVDSRVVSLIVVRAVADVLRQYPGAERASDQLAGNLSKLPSDPLATMPRNEFLHTLEQARRATGLPDLGLRIGEALTEMSFHIAGPLIMTSGTARQAISHFMELRKTLLGGPHWSLVARGSEVVLGFKHESGYGPGAQIEAELSLGITYQTSVRFWGPPSKAAIHMMFAFPAPAHAQRYRALFGPRVEFDGAQNSMVFPASYLDQQRPGVTPELAEAWQEFAAGRLQPPIDETWTVRVQRALRSSRNLAQVDFDQLAGNWGISLRTLRRKLEAEQQSMTDLLKTARFERACEQLASRTLSLSDIAESLGYLEVSSFHRAFRRWAGVAPGEYRKRALRKA